MTVNVAAIADRPAIKMAALNLFIAVWNELEPEEFVDAIMSAEFVRLYEKFCDERGAADLISWILRQAKFNEFPP